MPKERIQKFSPAKHLLYGGRQIDPSQRKRGAQIILQTCHSPNSIVEGG
jgi:hypothetical protein